MLKALWDGFVLSVGTMLVFAGAAGMTGSAVGGLVITIVTWMVLAYVAHVVRKR